MPSSPMPAKLDTLIFLMFLIPGIPKDTLNYLCPLTSISPVRFLVLSTFARIPSVISSTFAGANFAEGNLLASVIVLGITSAVGCWASVTNMCSPITSIARLPGSGSRGTAENISNLYFALELENNLL